jgi:hypothetical protein
MSTLVDVARSASFQDGNIVIIFDSGVEIHFPVVKNPRLAKGNPKQLGNIEISSFGLHWPELDEDLSFRGILAGNIGQGQKSGA